MNCLYALDEAYAFNGNTTAYVEMEDGVNEYGLAAGLCFVYPKINKPGFNAGMLIRYILEKCKTTKDAIFALKSLPIASSQTITFADTSGDIAVVCCDTDNRFNITVKLLSPRNVFLRVLRNFHFRCQDGNEKRLPCLQETGRQPG